MRIINKQELSKYNGRAAPAYVAYKDKIYDVSGSFLWRRGRHQALHNAGEDLTENLSDAPHRANMLERFPVVGILAGDQG